LFGLRGEKMNRSEHKSKERIDIEEALGVVWTYLQRDEDDFEKVSKVLEDGVVENITAILLEKNFIIKEKNKIKLTAAGEIIGKELTRRHRLTERLLADVLDFNRQEIEKIACDLEHNLSTDLADSICTLLGHPKQCPHGNPIPEGNCCKKSLDKLDSIVIPLSKIEVGEDVQLSYMVLKDKDFMNKLLSLGLVPGATLSLNKKIPTFVIKINDTQIAISKEIAEYIYVRK